MFFVEVACGRLVPRQVEIVRAVGWNDFRFPAEHVRLLAERRDGCSVRPWQHFYALVNHKKGRRLDAEKLMSMFLLASLALALVLTVVALVRQVRLRRALEKFLRIILTHWRSHARNHDTPNPDSSRRDHDPGDRL